MSKGFWGVIAVIVLGFVGVFMLTGNKADAPSSSKDKSSLTQHVKGGGSTGVKLVEYGDFQCPYCQQFEPTITAAVAEFEDQIFFQFRNFPIINAHPNAFAASRAAEAADLQGKYWEMHDALYSPLNWQSWTKATSPNPFFEKYAKDIGINVSQFKTDFASSKVNDRVNADVAEANRLGVTGTPTFFIDGKKVEITNSLDDFKKVIQAAIDKKSQ